MKYEKEMIGGLLDKMAKKGPREKAFKYRGEKPRQREQILDPSFLTLARV